jgi:hypothetical protein
MYSIKIMSGENLADSDVGKGFKMILVDAGDTFEFGHNAQGEPIVTVIAGKGDDRQCIEYPITGNAYVMSETGKTVASFWARSKPVYDTIATCHDDAITDTTDVTLYTPEQRGKIHSSRVRARIQEGATETEAMAAEARWLL